MRRLLLILVSLSLVGGGLYWWLSSDIPELTDRPLSEPLLLDETEEIKGETRYCKPTEGGYPSGLIATDGQADEYSWAEGGGCVHRSARDVWGTLHNQELLIWSKVTEYSITVGEAEEGVDFLYDASYTVPNLITIQWDMVWAHTLLEGTLESPERVVVNYRRTGGSRHLPYWEGTILIEAIGPELTGVTIRDQLRTMRPGTAADSADAIRSVHSRFERLGKGAAVLAPLDGG